MPYGNVRWPGKPEQRSEESTSGIIATLYLELRDSEVVETRDLDQDTTLDYDGQGKVVGITIEHAKTRVGGPRIELETAEA